MDFLKPLQHYLLPTSSFIFFAFTLIYPWKDKAVALLFPLGAFLQLSYASYFLWVNLVIQAKDLQHYYSLWPPFALLFVGFLLQLIAAIRLVRSQGRHIRKLLQEQQNQSPAP